MGPKDHRYHSECLYHPTTVLLYRNFLRELRKSCYDWLVSCLAITQIMKRLETYIKRSVPVSLCSPSLRIRALTAPGLPIFWGELLRSIRYSQGNTGIFYRILSWLSRKGELSILSNERHISFLFHLNRFYIRRIWICKWQLLPVRGTFTSKPGQWATSSVR